MRARIFSASSFEDFVDGELCQAVQLQFEDGVNLREGETYAFGGADHVASECDDIFLAIDLDALDSALFALPTRHANVLLAEEVVQILASVGAAGRSADDLNDVVDVVERNVIADQYVLALCGLCAARIGCGGAPRPRGAR